MSTERAPMPIGLDYFQRQVGVWADETFPGSTAHTIARHLRANWRRFERADAVAEGGEALGG